MFYYRPKTKQLQPNESIKIKKYFEANRARMNRV